MDPEGHVLNFSWCVCTGVGVLALLSCSKLVSSVALIWSKSTKLRFKE